MAWELPVLDEFKKQVLAPIVESACDMVEERVGNADPETDTLSVVSESVDDAIDSKLIYNVDMLAAVQAYGRTQEAFSLVYEQLYDEVCGMVDEELKDRGIEVG